MSKIYIILPNFAGGGAEKNLVLLANFLQEQALNDVSVVVFRNEGPSSKYLSSSIEIIDLNIVSFKFVIFHALKILRVVKGSRVVTSMFHMNILLCLLKSFGCFLLKDFYIIIREANTTSKELDNLSRFRAIAFKSLIKNFYKKANKIVAVSNYVRADLLDHFDICSDLITVINNLMHGRLSFIAGKVVDIKTAHKRGLNLIAVGRLVPQKDFFEAVRVVFYLNTVMEVSLRIVGSGPQRESLVRYARSLSIGSKVTFQDYSHDLTSIMLKCDALIATTRWEGFPNIFLDALKCGLPIVVRKDVSGVDEIVISGKNGIVVDGVEVKSFSDGIQKLLKEPMLRSDIQRDVAKFEVHKLYSEYNILLNNRSF